MLAASCAQIGGEYFQLPIAEADAVYRERVYCYELYHQLRRLWRDFPFSLGGEVDKEGHPHFKNGPYAGAKPDLLVHWPGNMDGNLACVEVKPGTGTTEQNCTEHPDSYSAQYEININENGKVETEHRCTHHFYEISRRGSRRESRSFSGWDGYTH
jgi:hypothetical protein